MRKIKQSFLLGLSALMCLTGAVHAKSCTVNIAQLPINNVSLGVNCDMMVTFNFPATLNAIYCVADGPANIGQISWPYAGKMHSSTLPVVLSKNARNSPYAIDPHGKFMIHNNLGRTMVVNCTFG